MRFRVYVAVTKWAGYIRESSEDQGKGFSPEVQVDYERRVIEASSGEFCTTGVVEGIEHLKSGFVPPTWVYGDIGGHGWDINRPGLKRLLGDAASGRVGGVVVWRQDRLARTGDVMRIIEAIVSFGAKVHLEGREYAPSDELTVRVRAAVSEEELNKMSGAISGGLRKSKSEGRRISTDPAGLQKTADHMNYETSEEGRRVNLLKQNGSALQKIAAVEGIGVWRVKRILRNIAALEVGSLNEVLEAQREAMNDRKTAFKERRRKQRKDFREWLSEIAPGKWE